MSFTNIEPITIFSQFTVIFTPPSINLMVTSTSACDDSVSAAKCKLVVLDESMKQRLALCRTVPFMCSISEADE